MTAPSYIIIFNFSFSTEYVRKFHLGKSNTSSNEPIMVDLVDLDDDDDDDLSVMVINYSV